MQTRARDSRFRLLDAGGHAPDDFAAAVREGLADPPRSLPCRFFYDHEGSLLFEEICHLPEYYLTRTERSILDRHSRVIVEAAPPGATVVELGSGSAEKTDLLLQAFTRDRGSVRFAPIDISRSALERSAGALLGKHHGLEVLAVHGEYRSGLEALDQVLDGPRFVLWLGSSIGNLDRAQAGSFLGDIAAGLHPEDRVLLGVDLRKDRPILERAYDDGAGVTARFNRNILVRINRDLGGAFRPEDFRHRARWEEDSGRVRISLESMRPQQVPIEALDMVVSLRQGEDIHTEDSWKYSLAEIADLAAGAGLAVARQWLDPRSWYSVSVLQPSARPTS